MTVLLVSAYLAGIVVCVILSILKWDDVKTYYDERSGVYRTNPSVIFGFIVGATISIVFWPVAFVMTLYGDDNG